MPANRKIFTKRLGIDGTAGWGTVSPATDNTLAWLMEEDIEVIGVELHAVIFNHFGNDGIGHCAAIVSQDGQYGDVGRVYHIDVQAEWNTAPAFGYTGCENGNVMFPAGHTIRVKEEGYLYLG